MAWLARHERTRTVDDVVALLHSDQEDDRAAGILDPAVPPVEVLALASRPGNGYRVRAALALCGALPADMRVQILRDEYAAETRKHVMPGFFFLQLETYGRELARRVTSTTTLVLRSLRHEPCSPGGSVPPAASRKTRRCRA